MFNSLKIQLLFFFFITNVVILSGFSVFIYNTAQKGISDNLDTLLKTVSIDIIPDLKDRELVDAKEIANELIEEFNIGSIITKIIYFNREDHTIYAQTVSLPQQSKLFNIPLNEMGHLHSIYYFDKDSYRISSMVVFEDDKIKIFFQLATKKIVDSPYLSNLLISLAITNPIILILFLLVANILINRTLQPVKEVVKSVHAISANQLSQRVNNNNIPTEIKELVETFNNLLQNLEESFNRISSFSSDASHELKTPLTVIRGEIEVSLRHERTATEYKAVLEGLLHETLQVQDTIEQLFFITKKGTSELKHHFTDIYLDEIITDEVNQIEKFASSKSIDIQITEIIPATIYANERLIKIAFNNLLRNAIIYSDESNKVRVTISEDEKNYLVTIEDSGCGIDKKDLPFIYDRFYRVSKDRSRKKPGTGLGLAIVKMILDIHHYDIEITSTIDQGTKAVVKILK